MAYKNDTGFQSVTGHNHLRIMKPGFYPSLEPAEYHKDPAMSSGKLKHFMKSPAHYLASLGKHEPSKEMVFGSAFHLTILEPARAAACVKVEKKVSPKDRIEADGRGLYLITEEEFESLQGMILSIAAHKTAMGLIGKSEYNESSVFWENGPHGFMCKARPDMLIPELGIIADLKTCADASPDGFSRAAANFGYDIQAAWYLAGCASVIEEPLRHFVFICIEKAPPYAVAVYRADDTRFVNAGRQKIRNILPVYAECLEKGFYPAYPDEILDIFLPVWAQPKEV